MNRIGVIVVLVLWLVIALATLVRAEPCRRAAPVRAGDVVPCDGDLVPAVALGRLVEDSRALALAKLQLEDCAARAKIDADEAAGVLEAERTARRACEESRTPPPCPPRPAPLGWWERPAFVIPATVAVTLGVVAVVLTVTR